MKILVVKSLPGFGDRMETLAMCVHFANEHKLQIYVDWTDPVWSEGFYKYFSLTNSLPSLDISPDLTVFPPHWHNDLKRVVKYEDKDYQYNRLQPVKADVVVWVCGWRYYYKDLSFFANAFKVIDQRVVQKVIERQQKYQLSDKIGIHLRGTDRAQGISKVKRFKELIVGMVSLGLLRNKKFIAISDDTEFIQMWKERFPDFPVVSDGLTSSSRGTHFLQTNKDELNVNLLVDFFTLASCSSALSTMTDSRFTNHAKRLHPYVQQILNIV